MKTTNQITKTKKTIILGASNNPDRYAYQAASRLKDAAIEFIPVGIKKGEVLGEKIINSKEKFTDIDTITLYISPKNQDEWAEYILATKPKRIIFNPGTENPPLAEKAKQHGIEVMSACTLVLLSIGEY